MLVIVSLTLCAGVTDAGGRTPLDCAIQEGHTETIEYLQSLGAPSAAPSQSTDPQVDQQPQGTYIQLVVYRAGSAVVYAT